MSEPFFDFLRRNDRAIAGGLYGNTETEKRYSRLSYRLLPEMAHVDTSLVSALRGRYSPQTFSGKAPNISELSTMLGYSIAKDDLSWGSKKYNFPSGGAFYPIETYLLVQDVDQLESGVYHYASTDHSIAKLGELPERSLMRINKDHSCFFDKKPPIMLYMTMVKNRITYHYGNLSYALVLAEAGHRAQNICLCASAIGFAATPMLGGNFDSIHKIINVDGESEHYVYGLAVGRQVRGEDQSGE